MLGAMTIGRVVDLDAGLGPSESRRMGTIIGVDTTNFSKSDKAAMIERVPDGGRLIAETDSWMGLQFVIRIPSALSPQGTGEQEHDSRISTCYCIAVALCQC